MKIMILRANGKFIDTTPIKHLITQGEYNSDAIYIIVDRSCSAMTDLSLCNFVMKGINANGERAEAVVGIAGVSDTVISLVWSVSDIFTAVAGMMKLELRAYLDDAMVMKYKMGEIEIAESPDSNIPPDIDVVENAVNAMQAEVAAAAASAAEAEQIKDETAEFVMLTPYIYMGTWWVYSIADDEYVDSHVRADATPTPEEKAEIENEVLSECLTAIQNIVMPEGETELSVTLQNNTEVRCFDALEELIIGVPESMPEDYRSSIVFISGSTPTDLTLPTDSVPITGEISIEANTKYELLFFYDGQDLCFSWFDIPIS